MTDLHIKYRPTSLDEVIGQEHIKSSLSGLLESGGSHSFLFAGASGVGKTTIARIAAERLGCARDMILEVDAATNSGVDAMRELTAISIYRPMEGGSKAIIIDECHALSKSAWQSLLKNIEEPPSFMFWFFCTTDIGKVPRTIQTRCTTFELRAVRTDDIFDRLVKVCEGEGLKTPDSVLDVIAQFARGSVRSALVGLSQVHAETDPQRAGAALQFSSASDQTIDFLRYLVSGTITWDEAMRRLDLLGEVDPESLRISIVNYLAAVLHGSKDQQRVTSLLRMIAAFERAYDRSNGRASLLLSIGEIVFNN